MQPSVIFSYQHRKFYEATHKAKLDSPWTPSQGCVWSNKGNGENNVHRHTHTNNTHMDISIYVYLLFVLSIAIIYTSYICVPFDYDNIIVHSQRKTNVDGMNWVYLSPEAIINFFMFSRHVSSWLEANLKKKYDIVWCYTDRRKTSSFSSKSYCTAYI